MIKLESVCIEGVRGIARKLELDFQGKSFAIVGPNGSGKSAVIDAVEFALTGRISSLEGTGTGGLSVRQHGPHVDKADLPEATAVRLDVNIPSLNKSAIITRTLDSPSNPTFEPDDVDVKTALAEVADHPEIVLSRRDIVSFILVEAGKRSAAIQALLKLDRIEATRAVLNATKNRLQADCDSASGQASTARDALRRHLNIEELDLDELLARVNRRRKELDLSEIPELTAETDVNEGLTETAKRPGFNKESALRDLGALTEAAQEFSNLGETEAERISVSIARLETDPDLLSALQRRSFVEKGLEFVEGPECPLCDTNWDDEDALRTHLQDKLAKSEQARRLQESILADGTAISGESIRIAGLIGPVHEVASSKGENEFARTLADWKADLDSLRSKLLTIDGLIGLKDRLSGGWIREPDALIPNLEALAEGVTATPDQSATFAAQTFLATAQIRLDDYRKEVRKEKAAEKAAAAAKSIYETYCRVAEEALNKLYEEVEEDFSAYYRELNGDDEPKFTAKFTPSEGKLGLDVDFYERGLVPPSAYHSEGHQDGMGVCLYLALMKCLFGDDFGLALLDDVVMSVDASHRYNFCNLLKKHFPDTQFIVTTHDQVWAAQMKAAGLVTAKTSMTFHSWSIDTGPVVQSDEEIWTRIDKDLERSDVASAALALRRHLEYVSRHLADQLLARPPFRADNNHQLGELMPAVLNRMDRLLGKASKSAQSWGKLEERDAIKERREAFSASKSSTGTEQWAVNPAVHYNEWANFGKEDFKPVVAAFRELLDHFRCPSCDSWVYVTPRGGQGESLRCSCDGISLNLKSQ